MSQQWVTVPPSRHAMNGNKQTWGVCRKDFVSFFVCAFEKLWLLLGCAQRVTKPLHMIDQLVMTSLATMQSPAWTPAAIPNKVVFHFLWVTFLEQ